MINAAVSATPITSLNAIKLSAREVAETFVAPPVFSTLLHADNAILTGPRGSGKTTLLKMMQSEALEYWTAEEAPSARDSVRAVGVFIGSDRTWNEQLAMPGDDLDPVVRRALTSAAFTTHVLRALSEAMEYRVHAPEPPSGIGHKRVRLDPVQEGELSGRLSEIFSLPRAARSLTGIRALLADRLVEIGAMRVRALRRGDVQIPDWVDREFVTTSDAATDAFNTIVGESGQKWALLFDELELAPGEIVETLLGALRGSKPRLIFKLSLAPAHARFHVLDEENAPVPGQDYEHIALTYARKLPALEFAKALVRSTLSKGGDGPAVFPERLLGSGRLDSRDEYDDDLPPDLPRSAYAVGSPLQRTMVSLAGKDPSFQAYLSRNAIDLDALEALPPIKRAGRVRKIRNIVVVREYFRDENGKRRSRKTHALYSGADSILSLPDGNPRMIISLVRQLFPAIDSSASRDRVPVPIQNAAIASTLQRFGALLEAQVAEQIDGVAVGLMDLLDSIGEALARRVVEDPFNDNVRLTIRVPAGLRPEIEALFIRGINAGALVHVPPRDSDGRLPANLIGRQFRLSHLLACKYGLPIHLTQSVSLDELLPHGWQSGPARRSPHRGASAATDQLDLFDSASETFLEATTDEAEK